MICLFTIWLSVEPMDNLWTIVLTTAIFGSGIYKAVTLYIVLCFDCLTTMYATTLQLGLEMQ